MPVSRLLCVWKPAAFRHPVLLVGLLTLLPPPAHVSAQMALEPGCPPCRIVVEPVVVLGGGLKPDLIGTPDVFVALGEDESYAVGSPTEPVLHLFDGEGVHRASLGRSGQGPGEFRMLLGAAFRSGGGLDVLDAAPRLVGFDPSFIPDLHVTPDVRLGFEVMRIRGDSLLVSGYSSRSDLIGLSAHVFPPSGPRSRSFGEVEGTIQSQDPFRLVRSMAASGDSAVWIAPKDRYHLELWSLDGQRLLTLTREVPWFDPVPRPTDGPTPPRGSLGSMVEDADGNLWISFSVPRPDWLTGAYRSESSPSGWAVAPGWRYQRIVEVIDPRRGVLLSSHTFPRGEESYSGLFGDVRVARGEVDVSTGAVTIQVLRLRLMR